MEQNRRAQLRQHVLNAVMASCNEAVLESSPIVQLLFRRLNCEFLCCLSQTRLNNAFIKPSNKTLRAHLSELGAECGRPPPARLSARLKYLRTISLKKRLK